MSPEKSANPLSILVIDDDARNCRLLSAFLQADGYLVLQANTGMDGIAIARAKQPDVVLLDLMMPGMDGFQVIQELKGDAATRDIPLLVSSALDDQASLQRVLVSGAQDFISKPIDRWELSLRLQRLLHGNAGQ